jgi:hypothetical protein
MLRHLLTTLANMLEGSNILYCTLHGWEPLPAYLPSDLDLIDNETLLNGTINLIACKDENWLRQTLDYS